jgi:HD-like signal output (HDOD) protein
MQTAQEVVATSVNLVTLPAIFIQVKRVADDKNASVDDLARVISADPAMTARVLKLINSSFWGVSGKIESLSRAVSLLGMRPVHDLVLATSVVEAFDRLQPQLMDSTRFWQGSVFRALAATALARQSVAAGKSVDLGRVFTQALMSDLGHMVMFIKMPELAAQALEETRHRPWALAQVERELIGCDFAQVGGALTDAWQLPLAFGEAIRHQSNPQAGGRHALEASLIHIAATLAELEGKLSESELLIAQIAPYAWEATGLDANCLPGIIPEVEINLMMTSQMFGIPLADK